MLNKEVCTKKCAIGREYQANLFTMQWKLREDNMMTGAEIANDLAIGNMIVCPLGFLLKFGVDMAPEDCPYIVEHVVSQDDE